jgi:hypothetical protein
MNFMVVTVDNPSQAVMWAILFFVLGYLVMVILHGWNNFVSMLTGWKKDPEY